MWKIKYTKLDIILHHFIFASANFKALAEGNYRARDEYEKLLNEGVE